MNLTPKVFLDLDGVIADWLSSALKLCGFDPSDPEVQRQAARQYDFFDARVGRKKLLDKINAAGVDFWLRLKPLPWASRLIALAVSRVGSGHVAFLSSPGKFTYAPEGKFAWVRAHFSQPLILTEAKHLLAHPRALLVDDDVVTTQKFLAASGLAKKWAHQFNLLTARQVDAELKALDHMLELL
jgi:hypothetical protein